MQHIIDYVFERNQNGDYFPLWGTCEGYQMITVLISGNYSIMIPVTGSTNISKPLWYYNEAPFSRVLQDLPLDLFYASHNRNLSFFNHHYTPDPTVWTTNSNITGNFTPLAYTYDSSGMAYVALIEGINMPIYGSQFHPEIAWFEWQLNTEHTPDGTLFAQYFSNFFVNECRKSNHEFPNTEQYVIYNYQWVNIEGFQTYFFWSPEEEEAQNQDL